MEDIAVIGLGLRFPGSATDPEALWEVLEHGESQWREIPRERVNIDGYYHPSGNRLGSIPFRGAHLLKEDVAGFDATFFSVTSDDAHAIDPQQRMLLEVSYEALENAGLRKEDIKGTDACVYVGSFVKDYEQICLTDPDWSPQYAATGNGVAIMANRISYFYDLHGPSMTVDTGCSGSLVSVHLGAQSLRNKESSLAIAAGAGMILTPSTMMPMTALNFLSPDGKCFTFDSRANGYGRGEGVGVVVMKRLSDAIRDNDTIRAVIRGTSVNQDGRTTGITLPSKEAQVANIQAVYAKAGLDFSQTAYVECHGTGTQAGDWRELKAISETLAADRGTRDPVFVGSIKPNIGHLEGAAGVAGMIKGVLVLEKGKIPPNINFESGNPSIDFQGWKVQVPLSLMDWPMAGLRRVSVNCFGFGGTNAHVILDEAPAYLGSRGLTGHHSSLHNDSFPAQVSRATQSGSQNVSQLFCYSASEHGSVMRTMRSHSRYIKSIQETCTAEVLMNYAYTLSCRRSALERKTFIVAKSASELAARLELAEQAHVSRPLRRGEPRMAFIFSGQGSQWARMGLDLMVFDVFRQSLEEASEYMRHALQSPFDLLREIFRDDSESALSFAHLSQPATIAIQVALVDLLRSFGVKPMYVVGHSSGEIAAAYAAGALTRTSAWRVAFFRGMAAFSILFRAPKLKGAMMVVGMSMADTARYLESHSRSAEIACVNSPNSTTISGRAESINAIAHDLSGTKVFHRVLKVQTAYHSSHMHIVAQDYRESLDGLDSRDFLPGLSMFSSVTGGCITGSELDSLYWAENFVKPVRYVAAVSAMMDLPAYQRPEVIVEIGPHAALRSPTSEILSSILDPSAHPAYYSAMHSKGDGVSRILSLAGELWTQGCSIDMKQVTTRGMAVRPKCLTDLPPYPWNHTKSYWHESHLSISSRQRQYPRQDLIGSLSADSNPFEPRWRGFLRVSENPWIQDHQVQKTIIYPAAGIISMVVEGAKQVRPQSEGLVGFEMTDVSIAKAMIIPNTPHGLEVALHLKKGKQPDDFDYEFAVYSKPLGGDWQEHASGFVHFRETENGIAALGRAFDSREQELSEKCKRKINPRQLYEALDTIGMNYGPLFQNLLDVYQGDGACVYKVRVPDTKAKMPSNFEYPHIIHPATLDSMFHPLFAIETLPMVPTFFSRIFISARVNHGGPKLFSGYATAAKVGLQDASASLFLKGSSSVEPDVVIEGMRLTALGSSGTATGTGEPGGFLPNFHNLSTEIIWKEDASSAQVAGQGQLIELLAHKYPALSILLVGGSGPILLDILRHVAPTMEDTPCVSRLTVLPSADSDLAYQLPQILRVGRLASYVESKESVADIGADYHIIVDCNEEGETLEVVKGLLKAGGAVMRGWPLLQPVASGNGNGHVNGHVKSGGGKQRQDDEDKDEDEDDKNPTPADLVIYKRPMAMHNAPRILLLVPETLSQVASSFIGLMQGFRADDGEGYEVDVSNPAQMLSRHALLARSIVISVLDITSDGEHGSSILRWDQDFFDLFKSIQKAARGIIWVTRGSYMEPRNLESSAIVGLGRVLMSEDPRRTFVTMDLDTASKLDDVSVAASIMTVFRQTFCEESAAAYKETEFAEKNGKIFVPRLRPIKPLNQVIEGGLPQTVRDRPFHSDSDVDSLGNLQQEVALRLLKPGLSSDAWQYTEFLMAGAAQADEVDIEFAQTLLTPQDVGTLLGRRTERSIGLDVVGVVKAVGKDVAGYRPGDQVVSLVLDGSVQSRVRVRECLVKPMRPSFFPSLFTAAYHAVVHMGRARPSKTVLIQGAASAHGLAAVEIVKLTGAAMFATVTGGDSEEQRELLQKHGVPAACIFSADGDELVDEIRAASGGKGVDVIYDTLGRGISTMARCVKTCGILVRLAGGTAASTDCLPSIGGHPGTVVSLDIRQLLRNDEGFAAELLGSVSQLLDEKGWNGSLAATAEMTDFNIGALEGALRHVQSVPCRGLCTLSALSGKQSAVRVVSDDTSRSLRDAIDPHGTYLLAGGLGGLGRSISELLVANGAKHIAFLSRSGTSSSSSSRAFVEDLQRRGIQVGVYCVDICDASSLNALVSDTLSAEMPAVRGVFQCAAVIRDCMFDNMSFAAWQEAFQPKSHGSLNLVEALSSSDGGGDDDNPFFVFLASSAGVIGSRGQANYAAGNSFQDALAHRCRLQGKQAVSIDLGPVLGAGMLTEDEEILNKLRASGFYGIRHDDFLTIVKYAITMEISGLREMAAAATTTTPAQIVLGVGTGGILRQNKPADAYWSRTALYAYLNLVDMSPPDLSDAAGTAAGAASSNVSLKAALARALSPDDAAGLVRRGLAIMLAKALTMLPEEIDVNKAPNAYGVDSLVAVGVRNWVLGSCDVQISVFEVLSNDSIERLAAMIAERGNYGCT